MESAVKSTLADLEGQTFKGEYLAKTDPLGADVPNPKSHVAYGAIGIGEITSIPTAPAVADAYYRYDGKVRNSLPLTDTPYAKE